MLGAVRGRGEAKLESGISTEPKGPLSNSFQKDRHALLSLHNPVCGLTESLQTTFLGKRSIQLPPRVKT